MFFTTSGIVFAPEGPALRADEGVLTVPVDRPLACLSVWYDGYRINAETGEELRNPEDLDALIASLTPEADEQPAESDDDQTDEDDSAEE